MIFVCVQCVERVCLTYLCPGADAASSPYGLQSMVVSANARLLTKMGRVYIDSKQRISKGMFDDDEFRVMCQAFYEAGGGRDTAPCLRRYAHLKYVNAEFECFRKLCKILGQDMLEYSEGNPFCQEMDDGATRSSLFSLKKCSFSRDLKT